MKNFVSKLENDYDLKQCDSFKNASLAREYSSKCRSENINKNELRATMAQSDMAQEKANISEKGKDDALLLAALELSKY